MIRTLWLILPLALAMRAQTGMVLQLTMKHAVELALAEEGSAKMQLAREFVVQAQSRSTQARSALLPKLDVTADAQNMTRNLAALGLTTSTLGFPVPSRVGPISVSDARAGIGQAVLDLGSVYRHRASKAEVAGTQSDADSVAEQVAADVAQVYLAVLRTTARVEAVSATLELAKSVQKAAENHRRAGNGTGLEVTRASLRVADERQKLLQAQVEKRSAERLLLRATGLRLDVALVLTDRLEKPPEVPLAADAFSGALRCRPDWKAQEARVQRAGLAVQSARAESVPSVRAFADYGATGSSPWKALATYTAGVSVQFSVYDGGRRRSRAVEAASQEPGEVGRAQRAAGGRPLLAERRAAPALADRRAALRLGHLAQPRAAPDARGVRRARGRAPAAAARQRPARPAHRQPRGRAHRRRCIPQERQVLT